MKALVQKLSAKPVYAKAFEWGRLITITGGGQILVQFTSLLSGILIIRLLPTQEYALYTLVNTMLGTMTVLADGGIAAGVMAKGGKVWQDRVKLGVVLSTGLALRRKFAAGSLLIAVPILLCLLLHHGATLLMSFLIVLSLIPAFFAALSDTLLEIAPKLRQDIMPLQKNQVGANLGRLILTGVTVFVFPWAFIAVLGGGLPRAWANFRLRNISSKYADWNQKPDPVIKSEILNMVKRLLPEAIYFCISGQITIWIISIFGSTASVAQLGALSRLTTVLSLFSVLFTTLVSPRFARLTNSSGILLKRYIQIQICLFVLSMCIIGFIWIFYHQTLWVLGSNYSNLKTELILSTVGSCLSLIYGVSFSLCIGRGWAINPALFIPVSILSIICGVAFIDVSSLKGIIILNIVIVAIKVIMLVIYNLIKILEVNKAKPISF